MSKCAALLSIAAVFVPALAQSCLPSPASDFDLGVLDVPGRFTADLERDLLAISSASPSTFDPVNGTYEVQLYDVTDPTNPQLASSIDGDTHRIIDVFGAFSSGGAWAIDISDPSSVTPPPEFWPFSFLTAAKSAGRNPTAAQFGANGFLYVFASPWVPIYDPTDPSNVTLVNEVRFLPDGFQSVSRLDGKGRF